LNSSDLWSCYLHGVWSSLDRVASGIIEKSGKLEVLSTVPALLAMAIVGGIPLS
jgi:hypothetical protein